MNTGKKVVLIYPEGRKTGNYPNQKGHDYTLQLPISLLPIAYFLQKDGYDPIIFDARVEDYRELSLNGVICVGISTMTGIQIANALEIAKYIRNVNPKIPIIWGGVHPTLLPEQTLTHDLVDIVVRSEGEATMLDLVRHLESGQPLRDVPGVSYKSNGSITHNPDRDFIDLNELQYLPYDLLDMDKYPIPDDGFFVNTSRGCPYNCHFCYNTVFHKRQWRYQSPAVVVKQIAWLMNKYAVTKFFFGTEDNFFVGKSRVEQICQGFIERGVKIKWTAFCRADYFARYSDSFIALLKKSGCETLWFGGESGSEHILRRIEKGILASELVTAARKCSEHGITSVFSFILGFPYETDEDVRKTLEVIDEILHVNENAEVNGIFALTPYPGTPLFATAKAAGFRDHQSLEEWANFQFNDHSKLPWLSTRKRSFMTTLARLSIFPFYSSSPKFPPMLRKGEEDTKLASVVLQLKRFAYWVLYMSARLRWKHKFFRSPVEWRLWDWYAKKERIW